MALYLSASALTTRESSRHATVLYLAGLLVLALAVGLADAWLRRHS
jgi:hypothetical protein